MTLAYWVAAAVWTGIGFVFTYPAVNLVRYVIRSRR